MPGRGNLGEAVPKAAIRNPSALLAGDDPAAIKLIVEP